MFRSMRKMLARRLDRIEELILRDATDRLRAEPRCQDPRRLLRYGHKVYSQSDEDGIIREIFARIGTKERVFVEFGIGSGLENNTYALLFDGWRGLWIEASEESVRRIRQGLPRTLESGALRVVRSFVTRENIDRLIGSEITEPEIDLLSIDIDGNDFHVFDAIRCTRPRVIVMEYNAKFPPPIRYCMEYDENHTWRRDDGFGASLKFLETELAARGYRLVGCNLTGVNAFFVRDDLVSDRFLAPFTAEEHYEPARYHLIGLGSGHRASFETLERAQPRSREPARELPRSR